MPDPRDLWAAADELLIASVASLNTIPVADPTLLGAQDRAFVDFGLSSLDCCDQLTVLVAQALSAPVPGRSTSGLQAGRASESMRLTHVYFLVTSTRCVPNQENDGTPPSVAELEASSAQLDADGWALWNHLYNLRMAGQLFTFCDEVFFDSMRPLGPSGGCAGWVLQIHISLDGYQEAIST